MRRTLELVIILPHYVLLQVYAIFLDVVLLVLPLILMMIAYGRIAVTLFHGFRRLNDDTSTTSANSAHQPPPRRKSVETVELELSVS